MVIFRALRDARSLGALAQGIKDDRQQVRWNAVSALAELHDVRAIPGLISMLGDHSQPSLLDAYDQTPLALSVAADGLVTLGTAAVPALIPALQHESPQIRGAAADCLGRIGDAAALPSLKRCATSSKKSEMAEIGWDTEPVSAIAARAIKRINETSAQPTWPEG
jgi:HEAT repeat protein